MANLASIQDDPEVPLGLHLPTDADSGLAAQERHLQPQISLEAAKLQQLGAAMGTRLRPESAQKIQVVSAKVHIS